MPRPTWVALNQGFEPPENWEPYPGCPQAPPNWPFWEENGAAWFGFFRDFQPPPARGLGSWFSLTAAGLFLMTATPFMFGFPEFLIGGLIGMAAAIGGALGVIGHFRKSASRPTEDPLDIIRSVAADRRNDYFSRKYETDRQSSVTERSYQEFVDALNASWWGENGSDEESS